jgi:dienelactone hydrolase
VYRREMEWGTLEKVIFSTRPEFRVPAYVLLPKKRAGRAPAIVDLHSHGGMFLFGKEKVIDLGANHPAMVEYHKTNYAGRPTATELVRRGYVVITIDAFPFGERRLVMDEDLDAGWDRTKYSIEDVRRLNRKCRAKESAVVKSLAYAGATWPGVTLWDDVRTLDYLCTRPEVDARRIGCVGVSFGGWRSLFLAGLDERIAASCVVGFMSTVKPMIRAHMETHSFVHFVPSLHQRLDLPDVVALRAPKPLLVLQCKRDGLFPLEGMEESVGKIAAIYKKAGAAERFTGRFYDVPHRFDVAMQDDAFGWFDAQLKG